MPLTQIFPESVPEVDERRPHDAPSDKFLQVIVGHGDVSGIPRHVHHLRRTKQTRRQHRQRQMRLYEPGRGCIFDLLPARLPDGGVQPLEVAQVHEVELYQLHAELWHVGSDSAGKI